MLFRSKISWIHIDDLCGIFCHLLEHNNLSGVFNGVAPAPVSNKELIVRMAEKRNGKRFIKFHIPAAFLRIMIGEGSVEILKSTTVSSKKITDNGFSFKYETIDKALEDLLANK